MQQFSGRRAKAARVLADLSREELAAKTGVGVDAIARWERGSPPRTRHLSHLAHALGVRVEELFDDVEVPA